MLKRQSGLKSVYTPDSARGISMPGGKNRKKKTKKNKDEEEWKEEVSAGYRTT